MQEKKKVLVIGAGGREHALAWKLNQSEHIEKIFVAPGNPGTALLDKAENINIKVSDFEGLIDFAKKENIYMTIVGPDDPLGDGIVDAFQEQSLRIWGPSKAAARLESSKAFAKDFMSRHNIPTAEYQVFKAYDDALAYCEKQGYPIVIKASGLALGKGVAIAENKAEAQDFLEKIFIEKVFGKAGEEVVIEEFLDGPEISIHAISDGDNFIMLPSAQDHKPVGEGNTGPNTGGMGTISPLPWISQDKLDEIQKQIVEPVIQGMKAEANAFVGLLYPGLKMTSKGPKVLEFNVRFGDPETQVYMARLKSDLFVILDACIEAKLDQVSMNFSDEAAACIILASGGYPASYEKGKRITGYDRVEEAMVFHAGTKMQDQELVTSGGRVMGVTALAAGLEQALKKAYAASEKIDFEAKYLRKDIGASYL